MPRGVRFGGDEGGDGSTSKFSLVETETEAGPEQVSRLGFLLGGNDEDQALSGEALARILDTSKIAAAEEELRRQKQLSALGSKVLGIILGASLVSFTLCIVLLVVYLRLKPVAPHFEVQGAGFVSVNIQPLSAAQLAAQQSSGTGNYFAAYFTFNSSYTVLFANPNPKVDLFVEELKLTIYYEGFNLGSVVKGGFLQRRGSSQVFKMFIASRNLPVPLKVYYTMFLVIGKRNYFGADLVMKGRLSTVAGFKSPPVLFRVRCTLVLKSYVVIERSCFHRTVV